MNGLDLFSGIGGISIALEPWVKTVAYCEQDRYAQGVLMSRMQDGKLERAPIWDDVRTLRGDMLPPIDILFGGFPCQDISCAGRGEGLAGERSGLFFEIVRLAEETRAPFVFLENVPGIRTRGLREVIRAFTDLRYDCRWTCISAAEVGAPHLRKRWFLLAHSRSAGGGLQQGRSGGESGQSEVVLEHDGEKESLADTDSERRIKGRPRATLRERRHDIERCGDLAHAERLRLEEPRRKETAPTDTVTDASWWAAEPSICRVAHGVPFRVDRLKCLGNAVVPSQARKAFEKLMGRR